jgi:hypothetical protein
VLEWAGAERAEADHSCVDGRSPACGADVVVEEAFDHQRCDVAEQRRVGYSGRPGSPLPSPSTRLSSRRHVPPWVRRNSRRDRASRASPNSRRGAAGSRLCGRANRHRRRFLPTPRKSKHHANHKRRMLRRHRRSTLRYTVNHVAVPVAVNVASLGFEHWLRW